MASSTANTPTAPWKMAIMIGVVLCIAAALSIFLVFPATMLVNIRIISVFSLLFLLSFFVPEKKTPPTKLIDKSYLIMTAIVLSMFFISHHISFLFFGAPIQLPHFFLWFSLWSFFSVTLITQHYLYHTAQQPALTASFLWRCKNTFADVALRRAFSFVSMGTNLATAYVLCISMILAIFHLFSYQPGFMVPGALLVLIVLILFFRPISLQCLALKQAISSFWLLSIACGICVLAIFISQWLNGFFPIKFSGEQSISLTQNMDILFFVSVFVITTPFFGSLIVKHAANISRKSLLLFFFIVPNGFFWMIQSHDISIIDNNIIFLVITIFFCRQFFSQKTTENFLTAALPLPKQRMYIPKNSLGLFTIHCLTVFTLYLLFSLDGIQAFSAITTCDALLIIGLIMISVVSYFGKSYRNKLISSSTNL